MPRLRETHVWNAASLMRMWRLPKERRRMAALLVFPTVLFPWVSWIAVLLLAIDPAPSTFMTNCSSNLGCSGLMTNISELTDSDPSSDSLLVHRDQMVRSTGRQELLHSSSSLDWVITLIWEGAVDPVAGWSFCVSVLTLGTNGSSSSSSRSLSLA